MEDIIKNPFPGLRAFEEEEEHLFFGRDTAVAELMSRLRTSRFLAVIGTSGSGKSSLIKAGLLPSLYRGFMSQAGSNWRVALFRPGDDPIGNLAQVLAGSGILYEAADDDDDRGADRNIIWGKFIETTLRRSNRGLIEVVKQARLPEHENLLIVVDQFEELFRFSKLERSSQDEKRDSTAFVNLLLESAAQVQLPVYILLTMRSDFLGDCTGFRGLPEAINNGQYLIPRMTRDEKRAAITGPVAVGGASLTSTLLSRLLNDVGENPDQLPILQHAMMRTWGHWAKNHREGEPLDLRHYEAIGTMTRALSKHAEEAFAELKTQKSRTICEKMFKLLTDRGETGRGVRRPARVSDICRVTNASQKEVIDVIDVFRQPGRTFLMPPPGTPLDTDSVLDISHESLMRIWTRLIEWVKEEEQSAELYLRLADAAALHREGKVGLWRDPELMFVLKWRRETKPNTVWANRYDPSFEQAIGFLEASKKQQELEIAEKEKEQRTKKKLRRAFTTIAVIGAVISMLFAVWALNSQREALKQKEKAVVEQKIAQQAREMAERKKDEAVRERERAAESEKREKVERKKAEVSANAERMAKMDAEKNQAKAEREERKAKENEIKEQIQGLINDMNKEEANFRQYLAKAKELAVHSISIPQNKEKELKALLALTAYRVGLNAFKHLDRSTRRIYETFDKSTLDKFERKEPLVDAYKRLDETYNSLQEKLKTRRQPEEIFKALREAYIAREESGDTICPAESWALAAVGNGAVVFNNPAGELLLGTLRSPANRLKLPGINEKDTIHLLKDTVLQASAFAEADDRLFCGTLDGSLVYWEKGQWRGPGKKQTMVHQGKILAMAFSTDRNCLVYSVRNKIYRYQPPGKPVLINTFEKGNFVRALGVIEGPLDGHSFLIVGDAKGNIFQADLSGSQKVMEKKRFNIDLKTAGSAFHAIAYNSSRKLLCLANSRGELYLFSGIDGKRLKNNARLPSYVFERKHKGVVRALAFSPCGRYLASGGLDRTVLLWDLRAESAAGIARQAPILSFSIERKILSLVFDHKGEYMIFNDERNMRICPTNPGFFYNTLCRKKTRDLSKDEWKRYLGEFIEPGQVDACTAVK